MAEHAEAPVKPSEAAALPVKTKRRGNPAWVKGKVINPGGRPKGLAEQIRILTNNLEAQVAEMVKISLRSKSERNKIEAIKWLADRSFGRAVETSVNVEAGILAQKAAAQLSTETLQALADALPTPIEATKSSTQTPTPLPGELMCDDVGAAPDASTVPVTKQAA